MSRRHKLLTKKIEKTLKPMYFYDGKDPQNIMVPWKIFDPCSQWTWYLYEYDPKSKMAFGYIVGHECELGYVSLEELENVRNSWGLPLERDKWWTGKTLAEIKAKHE